MFKLLFIARDGNLAKQKSGVGFKELQEGNTCVFTYMYLILLHNENTKEGLMG
jgi:hypothetical protein